MDELNKLLLEIENLNKRIYETDIFIRIHLKKLQDEFPKIWSRFLEAKEKYLNLINATEEKFENPLVKDSKKPLEKLKEKKCKQLYRKISQITHPDKTVNEYLNELFKIAKTHNETGDLRALETIYDVIQNQAKEPSYEFFALKIIELKKQIEISNKKHFEQITSFEYRVAVLYDHGDDNSKLEAEHLFIVKVRQSTDYYLQEIKKYERSN
jgi:hypothetical protein